MLLKTQKLAVVAFLTTGLFVSPALAEGDPVAGAKVFKKCMACHAVIGKNKVGPALNGVVGGPVGSVEGFKYSKVMKAAGESGMIWDEATLANYLANPRKAMKGNKMSFVGLRKEKEQADVIAYIKAESDK